MPDLLIILSILWVSAVSVAGLCYFVIIYHDIRFALSIFSFLIV